MRYFNTVTKTESVRGLHFIGELPSNVVELPEDNIFFSGLPLGYEFTYDVDGLPSGIVAIDSTPSPLDIRNEALSDITYTRPTDGVEIQIRDSQFFPQDEARMTKAINKLQPLETAPWISKDNQAITVTREDLEAVLVYQADEIERIFTDYIATL